MKQSLSGKTGQKTKEVDYYDKTYTRDYFTGKNSFFWKMGYGKFSRLYFDGMFSPIKNRVNRISQGKVLDAGCAYGLMLKRFPDSWKKFGLDVSDHAINIAKKKMPEAEFSVGSIDEKLPFEEGSFDLVLLNDVLEHLRNPEAALCNIYKVLKKGGMLYITTPNLNFIRRTFLGRIDKKEHHISMFSHREMKFLLASLNFGIEEEYTSFYFLRLGSNLGTESVFICKK